MIAIDFKEIEMFSSETYEFLMYPAKTFHFEHSLKSLTKWESKWRQPLEESLSSKDGIDPEQLIDYCVCMAIEPTFRVERLARQPEAIQELMNYIKDTPTATSLKIKPQSGKSMTMTSEVYYAYMALAEIPFTCDEWHLGKLAILLQTISILRDPEPEKMSRDETIAVQQQLNRQRRPKPKNKG